ncbi:GspH/FimT family pseudopilin [Pseudomonas sp. SCB32]|uniref:GspH/FimT family pseudopilin n=1 Tax=Pseudomonas sp. SCB32 TaxID=2653853 RepID=UPI0012648ECD|nr:GspH/FimT family pseudopilin [Pseudomonas sp. SCB32]
MLRPKGLAGFTLIELMVTIVVLVILISVAAPSFTSTLRDSQVATTSGELQTALQLARSEAVMRHNRVTVCRRNAAGDDCENGTDWSTGWLLRQSGGDIIKVWQAPSDVAIVGPNSGVTYQGNGMVSTATSLSVSQSSCSGKQKRTISVALSGLTKIEKADCQ